MKAALSVALSTIASGFSLAAIGADPAWVWAKQADVSASGASASATAVTVDPAGNAYVAGTFKGTVKFGGHTLDNQTGYLDVYVAKFDPNGAPLWALAAGGRACTAGGLAATTTQVYFTGGCTFGASFGGNTLPANPAYTDTFFLATVDPSGTFSRVLASSGTGGMRGSAVTLDGDGNILVAGTLTGSAALLGTTLTAAGGARDTDAFVAKLDAAATQLAWAKSGGSTDKDNGYAVAADGTGNVYLAGDILSDVSQGTATFGGASLTVALPYGSGDPFIAKLDKNGNWLWAKSIRSRGFDVARAIVADGAGNVYVAGRFLLDAEFGTINLQAIAYNATSAFVAKLDTSGNFLWAKQAGATQNVMGVDAMANALVVNGNGNPVVAGYYSGATAFGSFTLTPRYQGDAFVAEMDAATGSYLWVKSAGGDSSSDSAAAIAVGSGGSLIVAGTYSDTSLFDSISLAVNRPGEYYVADLFLASLGQASGGTGQTPSGSMAAPGPITDRSLTLENIQIPAADLSGGITLYIAADVGGTLYFFTPAGWTTEFQPYQSGVTGVPSSIALVGRTDLSVLAGTVVLLGYGKGTGSSALNDMLQNQRYASVYTLAP